MIVKVIFLSLYALVIYLTEPSKKAGAHMSGDFRADREGE
jgi:hypothetical protein